jgi:hypothetical protein
LGVSIRVGVPVTFPPLILILSAGARGSIPRLGVFFFAVFFLLSFPFFLSKVFKLWRGKSAYFVLDVRVLARAKFTAALLLSPPSLAIAHTASYLVRNFAAASREIMLVTIVNTKVLMPKVGH